MERWWTNVVTVTLLTCEIGTITYYEKHCDILVTPQLFCLLQLVQREQEQGGENPSHTRRGEKSFHLPGKWEETGIWAEGCVFILSCSAAKSRQCLSREAGERQPRGAGERATSSHCDRSEKQPSVPLRQPPWTQRHPSTCQARGRKPLIDTLVLCSGHYISRVIQPQSSDSEVCALSHS